ncbi:MAG TPA: hypothetical protein DCX60_10345 [Phycisphaerales bacterium]|nr:hypothetical protein [Phycisphaerales bacterium]
MEPQIIITIAAIGFAGGLLGGLLGIGGSIIVIPLLTLVKGNNQQLYQATAMIMNIAVGASATLKHHLKGAIQVKVVLKLLPAASVGILAGVALSNLIPTLWLQVVFALALMCIAASELRSAFQPAGSSEEKTESDLNDDVTSRKSGLVNVVIGGFTGLCSGLLGIGGGIIIIPLLKRFSGFSMKAAIPASSATMLITAGIGAFYKNIQLPNLKAPDGTPLEISNSLLIAACLIPTAFVGSYIGASMMHRLPMTVIKRVFALLLVIAAWRMGYTALNGVQETQDDATQITSESTVPRMSPGFDSDQG